MDYGEFWDADLSSGHVERKEPTSRAKQFLVPGKQKKCSYKQLQLPVNVHGSIGRWLGKKEVKEIFVQ